MIVITCEAERFTETYKILCVRNSDNYKPAYKIAANLDPEYIIVKQMNSSYHSERLKMVLIK